MNTSSRYAITLPGVPGGHAPPEVVIVHATGETTRDGQLVFADATGTFRVEIADGIARPLVTPAGPGHHNCLHAQPMP
ncbi:DUF6296 family protein [Kitasatospora aureofaciens]|uniref:DUF6296 family protein n=1 Tax=Kitasatospora aureofaciens TaxID=1894 RepID=UPI0033DD3C8A